MQRSAWMACVAALALCAPGAAQRPGPPGPPNAAAVAPPPPPVYALMGHREALALSGAQIAALDSLASWLSAADRPLLRRIADAGSRRARGDTAVAAATRALAANRERAAREVESLLTPAQRTRTCELFRARPARPGEGPRPVSVPFGGGGRAGGNVTRAPGPPPGGVATDLAFFHWPWCPPPEPAPVPRPRRP